MGLIQRTERRSGTEIAQPKPAHGCSPAYMASGGSAKKWIQGATSPKTKGALHEMMGVPQGQKIPAARLESAVHSDNPLKRHRAQFALNVRK